MNLLFVLKRMFSFDSRQRRATVSRLADKIVDKIAVKNRSHIIDQLGTAVTDLGVYGYIEVSGRRYEARSNRYVFIGNGSPIRVVGRENYAYLVEPAA